MEMKLNSTENLKVAEVRAKIEEGDHKVDIQIAHRSFEEALRMHAATKEQEGDDPEDGGVDEEDERDVLATGPELQQGEEEHLPTGTRPSALSVAEINTCLTLEELENRNAEKEAILQMAKLKLAP
ncbi:hypothetical protein NDU88_001986 [Pleurodeles waltl]|uniref:Uncharacterized protein n=1 Tax=Pleurodeles waltl TaxID=8319 RepID=A0AAV7UUA5_PLEWA|nr:hypothetical protein NDU88_001986 [Pleurodeles waltl]